MTKRILLVFLLLLLSSPVYAATDWTQEATCEGAWLMNADESPLTDSSGEGRTGALASANKPNYVAGGKYDGGYEYTNDNGEYITISDQDVGAVTYSSVAWLNVDQQGTSYIMDWRDSVPGAGYWYFAGDGTNQASNDGTRYINGAENDTAVYGEWAHYAVTGQTLNFQVLIMGNRSNYSEPLDGPTDEWAIFSETLSITDVNEIMDNGLEGDQGTVAARRVILISKLKEHPWDEEYARSN